MDRATEILVGKLRQAKEKIECSDVPKRKQLAMKERIYKMIMHGQEEVANAELDRLKVNEKVWGLH